MAVKRFEELLAYQQALELTVEIWHLLEKTPVGRNRVTADQMWRSALSITSNIAEGFEKYTRPEFSRYLGTAKGSCGELRSQLHVVHRVGLLPKAKADQLINHAERVGKLIGALRASLQRKRDDEPQ